MFEARIPAIAGRLAIAIALGAGASALLVSPTYAGVATGCTLTNDIDCESGTLPANKSGHYINVHVCAGGWNNAVGWRVYDTATLQAVGEGSVILNRCVDRQITGLYGSYRLQVSGDSGGHGYISN